jgi:hypothetical protein
MSFSTMSNTQKITFAFGAFYVLIGILGFVPGITTATANAGQGLLLGIFAVNTIHNIAHLVLGLALVAGSMSAANTLMVNKVMAVVFLLLVVASFIAPILEQLPLNLPDTILHLVSALLTGYLGFMGNRSVSATA